MLIDWRFTVKVALLFVICLTAAPAHSQVQLKNNVLYDLSLTPNANVEVGLSRHWTFDLGFGLNPWTLNGGKKIRHWLLQPEWRRYFCQRMNGSFVAFHLMGGEFNAGGVRLPLGIAPCLRNNRYEGWYAGGGIGYGYQWPVSRHFSVEAEVAVGYDYLKYRQYPCEHCGTKIGDGHYHYVGPTKIALNLIYNINQGTRSTPANTANNTQMPALPTTLLAQQTVTETTTVLGGMASISGASLASMGQQMVLAMDVCLDQLTLRHGQTVVLRPVLRSADGQQSVRFRPLLVNSRDQHVMHLRGLHNKNYPDAIETQRRNGRAQTVSYLASVPQELWMDSYTIEIEEDLCGCGDPIADNTTPLLTPAKAEPLPATDLVFVADLEPSPYKPVRNLHGTAFINFVVDRWEMKPDYMSNQRELHKITDTLNIMVADRNISVDRIKIHGWASPESPYEHNRMLAQNRAQSLTNYLKTFYSLPDNVFAPAEATPENWVGLLEALDTIADARLPHKAEFISTARQVLADVSSGVTTRADRMELALRQKYPAEYNYVLKNIYPHLRRSDYEITFRVREFTLQEAQQIYLTHPDQLSLYEFWQVAQTMEPYSDDYDRCMQIAYTYYPDSTVAAINVANGALRKGDLKRAEAILKTVGTSMEASEARRILQMLKRRNEEAEQQRQQQ